jgi:hypothetical protein
MARHRWVTISTDAGAVAKRADETRERLRVDLRKAAREVLVELTPAQRRQLAAKLAKDDDRAELRFERAAMTDVATERAGLLVERPDGSERRYGSGPLAKDGGARADFSDVVNAPAWTGSECDR